eukprot:125238-Rhodomonas_salina.2
MDGDKIAVYPRRKTGDDNIAAIICHAPRPGLTWVMAQPGEEKMGSERPPVVVQSKPSFC